MPNLKTEKSSVIEIDYSGKTLEELVRCKKVVNDDFYTLIEDLDKIRHLASILYNCDKSDITIEEDGWRWPHRKIRRYNIEFFDGRKSMFYIKKSLEGGLKEAVGMELMNMLSETEIRYVLIEDDILLIEHVKGSLLIDMDLEEYKLNCSFQFQVGKSQEYALFLGLADRDSKNLVLSESGEIVHIDFGLLFERYPKPDDDDPNFPDRYFPDRYSRLSYPFSVTFNKKEEVIKGREYAKNMLYTNLIRNLPKVKAIYSGINEELGIDSFGFLRNYCQETEWNISLE